MRLRLDQLQLKEEWPTKKGINHPTLMLSPLADILEKQKLLILYGPSKAGKTANGYFLIDSWLAFHRCNGPLKYYDIEHKGILSKDDGSQLTRKNIKRTNDSIFGSPTLYVFDNCENVLNVLDELFGEIETFKKVSVLISVDSQEEILRKFKFFNTAIENSQAKYWIADINVVREIINPSDKKSEGLGNYFSTEFCDPALPESANLNHVEKYLRSDPRTINNLNDWVKSENNSNPKAFYSGGPAKVADIRDNLDVPRTQYVDDWKGKLLDPDLSEISGPSLIIVCGPSGSGKLTLCKRMIYDLKENSILTIDLFHKALGYEQVRAIRKLMEDNRGKLVHAFTTLESVTNYEIINPFLAAFEKLSNQGPNLFLTVAIDTNQWRQIESSVFSKARTFNFNLQEKYLLWRLDNQEINGLVERLRNWDCLVRLKGKTENAIRNQFRRNAGNGLLTCLIESTRGTDRSKNFKSILWNEYEALSENARWAYSFVMLFAGKKMGVPPEIFRKALEILTKNDSYIGTDEFIEETADIIWNWEERIFKLRHPLIAKVMIEKFKDPKYNIRINLLAEAWFNSLDLEDEQEKEHFEYALRNKVLDVISDLEPLANKLCNSGLSNFKPDRMILAKILNSIIRIYQREPSLMEKRMAHIGKSLSYWRTSANPALYFRGVALIEQKKFSEAKKVAYTLARNYNPACALNGIELLYSLEDWEKASDFLKRYERTWPPNRFIPVSSSENLSKSKYFTLQKNISFQLKAKIGQLTESETNIAKPSIVLKHIKKCVANGAEINTIVSQCRSLVERENNLFNTYIFMFSYLFNPLGDYSHEVEGKEEPDAVERYKLVKQECEYHINRHENLVQRYPDKIRSLLYSNLAFAIFKLDRISENAYEDQKTCESLFKKAIAISQSNAYAYNWYATFLKEVKGNFEGAETYYSTAKSIESKNPVFHYNLALLYHKWANSSKEHLMEAKVLAQESISLCTAGTPRESFAIHSKRLLDIITIRLSQY